MSQWNKPPPLVILSGAEEFLRTRELKDAITAADTTGREVQFLDGSERDALSGILSSSGMFFKTKHLVVISNPEKVDADLVLGHHERGNTDTCVVLHCEGDFKAKSTVGKIAKKLPSNFVAKFGAPKPWEAPEQAIHFVIGEARKKKLKLDKKLAAAMVENIGVDYGILTFEIDKVYRLIQADGGGTKEITAKHIKAVIAGFSSLGPMPIVEALGRRDLKSLSRALTNMRRTHSGALSGAALRACALVGHNVTTWLHCASLLSQGAGHDEIAERIKLHAFVVRKNILPVARRWSQTNLVALLNSIAAVERSVRSGHANPWVEFECALFHALENRDVG
jgi:DNA polymerase III delta subunit